MANNLVKYCLFDGSRRTIVRLIQSNASTAETFLAVNPADYDPVPTRFVIERIWQDNYLVAIDLYWDPNQDIIAYSIPAGRGPNFVDFEKQGGLYDVAQTSGGIWISTRLELGLGAEEGGGQAPTTGYHQYDITLDLRKKYD